MTTTGLGKKPEGPPTPVLQLEEQPVRRRLADNQPTTWQGRLRQDFQYLRGRGSFEIGLVYGVLLVAFIVVGALNPDGFPFLSPSNLSGVLTQSIPVLALIAIGAGILMIAGEFDLSLGAAIAFSAIVYIRLGEGGLAWPLAFLAAIASSIAIALVNGLIVILGRIPSFIATLGMSFFWGGAAIFVNGVTPAVMRESRTDLVVAIFAGNYGYFRSQLIWMIVFGILAGLFLHRHRLGNHIFAVGGNIAAARAVGIKPAMVKLLAFGILGLMGGIAAVLLAVRQSGMQPGATESLTLFAIAAAVVGGCSLTGGRGTIVGMIVGAALIRTVENGLILAKAPGFYIQLFVGVTIVVAAVLNKFVEGRSR